MKTLPATVLNPSLLAIILSCNLAVHAQAAASEGWVTAGANPQRTSWVPEAAPGALKPVWVKPIEPYISQKVQIIAASGKLFLSTARGLYAFDADTGNNLWVYPTELPLGHSPTYVDGRVYVGGLDRKIHAIDADSGQRLWTFNAAGGFHTSPLVVGGRVYAGSRDGCMYAVDAGSGELVWKHQTGGQILQSAAYHDGVIFFGSQDARAYALDARTGAQVWRSDKLPGMGWHSWWPVIYKDVVLFTRTEVEKGLVGFQNEWLFSGNKVAKNLPGIRGAEPGGWAAGEPTVDIRTNPNGGTIPDWFERYPWRRSLIVLDRKTGREVTFDLDNDGLTDAAPMLWAWTHGGTCYPPLVSGHDGVIYFRSVSHAAGSSIPGAVLVGWKYGTPFLSLPVSNMSGQSGFWPGDEPVGISAGGSCVYWNLCNDRFVGSADLSIANAAFPETDGRRQWRHMSGDGFKTSTLPAGYNSQVSQYLWSVGPANIKPMYWAHGDNVGPTIYNGKMYVHRGNAIIAFGPNGLGSGAPVLPAARTRPAAAAPEPLSETALRERLETEVSKILDRGHLTAGFAKIGLIDFMAVNRLGEYLLHYWHNPADMLITLLRALPHLPSEMQDRVRRYLRDEYAALPPYKYMHIGFTDGAPREPFDYPPSTPRIFEHDVGPLTSSSFPGWNKPPHNVYAMWKYAQAGLADPATVFEQAAGLIGSTPSNRYLQAFPHVHNAYIAGYVGYVGLAKMADRPYATQEQELDRLLRLRGQTFRWDVQADTGAAQSDQYFYTLITAWNFMFLVPELADYLRENALEKVQEAVDRYTRMAPYWMAGHNEEVQHENGITPLYQTHALFQAKAQILHVSRDELAKVLDTPVVPAGDLFYLQNLIATLEASPTGSVGGEANLRSNLAGRLDGYFADPVSGDLTLTSAAVGAIDQGASLPGITDDIRGRPRSGSIDLGAWEFGDARHATPVPASRPETDGTLQAGATVRLGTGTATIKRMDALPYVESEYTRRFRFDSFDNPKLKELRERYQLDAIVAPGKDEFERQVLLLDWVHRQFKKFGRPSSDARGALEILQAIDEGHTFFCSHYAHVFVSAAASLGWIDRELALRRHQDPPQGGSSEHATTEIWSNQYRKWVMMDPTANMHIEKEGTPLNAYEIRQEWFHRAGRDLVFVVGKERKKYRKFDLPIFLGRFEGFGDLTVPADEVDKYGFIGYIPNTDLMDAGLDYGQMFIVKDQLCEGTRWHQRTVPANPAVDPYFPINQAAPRLVPEQDQFRVTLQTLTPNFRTYEARTDGGTWRSCDASFRWSLRPGSNRLEVRTVNRLGIEGPISAIEVEQRDGPIPHFGISREASQDKGLGGKP